MRINAVVESLRYSEQRKFNDSSQYNTKQNNNNSKVSFSEILNQAIGSLYLPNNTRRVNKLGKKR
ncbi:hypothetical protein [Clostridium sp. YIM B02551]|uniref:hypothetical protein n=1 Tax=Clostridium sp. YIM B02551 TaxID=2910679 RepID=UPI001EEA2A7F|nr:hypothetical protein [Clostridium sp. YIM B02551]